MPWFTVQQYLSSHRYAWTDTCSSARRILQYPAKGKSFWSGIWYRRRSLQGLYKNDTDLVRQYGKIVGSVPFPDPRDLMSILFRVYEGRDPTVLLSDPELLRQVLIKDAQTFLNRRVTTPLTAHFLDGSLDRWGAGGATGVRIDTIERRTVEKCSGDCLTDFHHSQAPSGKMFLRRETLELEVIFAQMYSLMDEIGDRYNTRLCHYADQQAMFNIRE